MTLSWAAQLRLPMSMGPGFEVAAIPDAQSGGHRVVVTAVQNEQLQTEHDVRVGDEVMELNGAYIRTPYIPSVSPLDCSL